MARRWRVRQGRPEVGAGGRDPILCRDLGDHTTEGPRSARTPRAGGGPPGFEAETRDLHAPAAPYRLSSTRPPGRTRPRPVPGGGGTTTRSTNDYSGIPPEHGLPRRSSSPAAAASGVSQHMPTGLAPRRLRQRRGSGLSEPSIGRLDPLERGCASTRPERHATPRPARPECRESDGGTRSGASVDASVLRHRFLPGRLGARYTSAGDDRTWDEATVELTAFAWGWLALLLGDPRRHARPRISRLAGSTRAIGRNSAASAERLAVMSARTAPHLDALLAFCEAHDFHVTVNVMRSGAPDLWHQAATLRAEDEAIRRLLERLAELARTQSPSALLRGHLPVRDALGRLRARPLRGG